MRALRSLSTGLFVLVGTLVFVFIVMLSVAVTHMDRNDPRALLLAKVIGDGGLFLGLIFLLIRQEMTKFALQRTEGKLEVNTKATVETNETISRVAEQTNGGLDKRMRDIVLETVKGFPTKCEMQNIVLETVKDIPTKLEVQNMVKEAAQIAVERAARKRRRQR